MTKPKPIARCRHCGADFLKPHKRAVFCAPSCAVMHKVDVRGEDECWPWKGAAKQNGYGSFGWAGKGGLYPHRAMLEIKLGRALGPREDTRHKCDNRRCCNPAHLEPGSRGDNMKDCRDRGRMSPPPLICGARHYRAKLTEADVLAIRASSERETVLAAKYGINQTGISKIRRRETWRHI